MADCSSAANVKITPVNVLWQAEESEKLDFTGLTGLDVKGKYIVIYSAKDATGYYLWGDDSVAADPAPAGLTALPFTVTGDSDSAATLAAAAQVALDGNADFSASVDGAVVDVVRAAVGRTTDTVDGDMGLDISKCQDGVDFDLGLLDGDIDFSPTEELFDVTSQQTGTTVVAALRQGNNVEVTTVLQETTFSKLKEFYGYATGGFFTPSGGTELFGQGSSRQGDNVLVQAARLILRPVNAADTSEDLTVWKSYPLPDSLTFSGENPRLLSVTWRAFNDSNRPSEISLFAFGDGTQAGIEA